MVARFAKTYARPEQPEAVLPISNKFTLDLAGLNLTEGQLDQVRQEAVKAAMVSASEILGRAFPDIGNVLQDFGTFSTFSTFSTFGSGAARPGLERALTIPTELPDATRSVIEATIGQPSAPRPRRR